MKSNVSLLITTATVLLSSSNGFAISIYWSGQRTGDSATWGNRQAWSTDINTFVPLPSGSTGPGSSDIAIFDMNGVSNSGTGSGLVYLNLDRSVLGLQFRTEGDFHIENNSTTGDPSTHTLHIGSSGIDSEGVAHGTNAGAVIDTLITLDASQTWINTSSHPIQANGNINLQANSLNVAGTENVQITGVISGTAGSSPGLVVGSANQSDPLHAFSGTLTLSGTNSYTGGTTIWGGTVVVNSDRSLGDLGAGIGNLNISGGTLRVNSSASFSRWAALTGAATIETPSGFNPTFFGNLLSFGSLTKTGTGTLNLTGINSYSAGTTINGGTLNFGAPSAMPTSGNTTVNAGARLTLTTQGAGTFSFGAPGQHVTLNGGTLEFDNTPAPNFSRTSLAADVAIGSDSTISTNGGPYAVAEIDGAISGTAQLGVNGWVALDNANPFTGVTRIVGGGLLLENSNALAHSTLSLAAGDTGVLSFRSLTSATFGGLSGSRNLSLQNDSSVPVSLTVGTVGTTNTYSGILSGSGSLAIQGGGSLQLSNTGNSYAGGTMVNVSNLLANGNTLGSGSVTLNGSSLIPTSSANISQSVVIGALGGAIDTQSASPSISGAISGTGTFYKRSGNSLTLTGTNTLVGNIEIDGGTLNFGAPSAMPSSGGDVIVNSATTLGLQSQGSGIFNYGTPGQTIYLNDGATLAFSNTGGTQGALNTLFRDVSLAGNTAVTSSGPNFVGEIRGSVVGTGSLLISGNVKLTGNANSYSGGTLVNNGVVIIGSDSALGSAASGLTLSGGTLQSFASVSSNRQIQLMASGGSIDANGSSLVLNGKISGTGALTKIGNGTATIGNATNDVNDYSGATTVSAGVLAAASQNAFGNSTQLTVAQGATLDVSAVPTTYQLPKGTTLAGFGTVNGAVTNFGNVAPGSPVSPGTTHLNGDYIQTATGEFDVTIGEPVANAPLQSSQLVVSGRAALGGKLNISIVSGSSKITTGTEFTILTANSIGSPGLNLGHNFDTALVFGLPNGLAVHPIYGTSIYRLSFVQNNKNPNCGDYICEASFYGDMNSLDGLTTADIPYFVEALRAPSIYADQYGSDYSLVGDFDGNGRLDFGDIQGFSTALSQTGAGSQADMIAAVEAALRVPEPSTALLLALGSVLLFTSRWRH